MSHYWTAHCLTFRPPITLYNGQPGAGQLTSVDGPYANDTLNYTTYDDLGRVTEMSFNGSSSSVAFDNVGRVTTLSNALGTFTNSYVTGTGRVSSITYPNGQTAVYDYYTVQQDLRLKEIKYLDPAQQVISKHNYEYTPDGQIKRWTQQPGTLPARDYDYGYDAANQLTSARLRTPVTGLPTSYLYAYDKAGNRGGEQIDRIPSLATFNNLNQLLVRQGGAGPLQISGAVDKDATVQVNGQSALVANRTFTASILVMPGANTFTVSATDFRTPPNTTTHSYAINVGTGPTQTHDYDFNGNLLSDGQRTYKWDVKNQLVSITYNTAVNGIKKTEFTYNGAGCRVAILERDEQGNLISLKRHIWLGNTIAEERVPNGTDYTTTKQYYSQGFVLPASGLQPPVSYFYTRDHLGSVREVTDSSGAVHARYEYDPYGRVTKLSGEVDSDFLYTGHYYYAPSNLYLTKYRAYDPSIGRWLSRDPLKDAEQNQGPNLYSYVWNSPANAIDPLGLAYFGVCPLAGMNGIPPAHALDDCLNTELLHEQLFFEDGKSPQNIGYGDKGFIIDDQTPYTKRDGGYNDCVMRKAVAEVNKNWKMKYFLIGHNCQVWAATVRSKYSEFVKKEEVKRECCLDKK